MPVRVKKRMIKYKFNFHFHYWKWRSKISLLWKSYFLSDVDIENIFISKKISSCNNYCKYFIAYLDVYNIKPFCTILAKTRRYINIHDCGTKRMMYWENIMIFRVKLAIVSYTKLIVKPSILKKFGKLKWNLTVTRLQIFMVKKCSKYDLIVLV